MNSLTRGVSRYFKSVGYLLATFPVSIALFMLVGLGLASGLVFPVAAVIFLLVMSAMERVAAFEVRRTNRLMGTDFEIPQPWLTKSLWSWDGVKERVTSTRGWMTVAYIVIAFGWSLFAFLLIALGISGVVIMATALGLIALSSVDKSFEVVDGGDRFAGSIQYAANSGHVNLIFGDSSGTSNIAWDFDNYWSMGLSLLLILWAAYTIPSQARGLARLTQGLLAGGFSPQIDAAAKDVTRRVRKAMNIESTRTETTAAEPTQTDRLSELTDREREILGLLAQGLSNSAIASALFITEGSVEKHVSNIMFKLDLPVTGDSHRRVLAVLAYLESQGSTDSASN